MQRKENVHKLINELAHEIYGFIKESESFFSDGWVPAIYIKNELGLKLSSYPKGNKIDNETGWFFNTLARILQDENLIEFKKDINRSYYKSKK
jgi:CBS domain containing-hemolysin-like protein